MATAAETPPAVVAGPDPQAWQRFVTMEATVTNLVNGMESRFQRIASMEETITNLANGMDALKEQVRTSLEGPVPRKRKDVEELREKLEGMTYLKDLGKEAQTSLERIQQELNEVKIKMASGDPWMTAAPSAGPEVRQIHTPPSDEASAKHPSAHYTPGKKSGWDFRRLMVKTYNDCKTEWKDYSFTIKAFVRRECAAMADAMDGTEYGSKPLPINTLRSYNIDAETDAELSWLLVNFTGGTAKDLVRLKSSETGLETWRALTWENDPRTGVGSVKEMIKVIKPPTSSSYQEFAKSLRDWDNTLKMEASRNGPAAQISDAVKATALISKMPPDLQEDTWKKGIEFVSNYHEVRRMVDEMIRLKTADDGPSTVRRTGVHNVQDE